MTSAAISEVVAIEQSDLPAAVLNTIQDDFVISFPRSDFPLLQAASFVDRKGLAWFDVGPHNVRLAAMGNALGITRLLSAKVPNLMIDQPHVGFGIMAAELPSVVKKARREAWSAINVAVSPRHGNATVTQDRAVLSPGTPPEMNLFTDLFEEGDDDLDKSSLTVCFERSSAIDSIKEEERPINLHLPAFLECLSQAEDLIPNDGKQRQCEILEFCDGFVYGGNLHLKFWLQAPTLKGIELWINLPQVQQLQRLLKLFDSKSDHYFVRGRQHNIFTDRSTTLYARIPDRRNPLKPSDLLANQPNTGARLKSAAMRAKLPALRTGGASTIRYPILRIELVDEKGPRLKMDSHARNGPWAAGAGNLRPSSSEALFDLLTELSLFEKAIPSCEKETTLQSNREYLFIRSGGPLVSRTVKIRAFVTEPERLETQIRNLERLV